MNEKERTTLQVRQQQKEGEALLVFSFKKLTTEKGTRRWIELSHTINDKTTTIPLTIRVIDGFLLWFSDIIKQESRENARLKQLAKEKHDEKITDQRGNG